MNPHRSLPQNVWAHRALVINSEPRSSGQKAPASLDTSLEPTPDPAPGEFLGTPRPGSCHHRGQPALEGLPGVLRTFHHTIPTTSQETGLPPSQGQTPTPALLTDTTFPSPTSPPTRPPTTAVQSVSTRGGWVNPALSWSCDFTRQGGSHRNKDLPEHSSRTDRKTTAREEKQSRSA